MRIEEYLQYDAMGLASLVRRRQVSPSELCDIAIQQIESLNDNLNAVVSKDYERAVEQVSSVD